MGMPDRMAVPAKSVNCGATGMIESVGDGKQYLPLLAVQLHPVHLCWALPFGIKWDSLSRSYFLVDLNLLLRMGEKKLNILNKTRDSQTLFKI